MNANIDKQVLDTYRQSLVEAVEKSSPRYAEFRKVWGSLNALEKDAVRATERELNRSIKAQDKFKFMAGEQVLYAIAKGNANYLLPAAGTWIGGKVWHHLRSPNKAIKDMFRDVAEELGPIRMTYPQPKTPEPDLWRSPLGNPNDRFPPRGDVVDTEARDLIQGGLPPVQNRPQIGFDPSKSPIPLPNGPVPTGPQVKASRLDGSIQSPPQYDPLNMTTEEILDALRKGLK
jgi:hypothetical protein